MKNYLNLFAFLLLVGLITISTSCKDDEELDCSDPAEWIGNYTIIGDTICSTDNTLWFTPTLELETTNTDNAFEYDGDLFPIINCTATDGFITFTRDEDKLTLEFGDTGCSWEFTK